MDCNSLFTYDAESGRLLWRVSRPGRGCVAGWEAGTKAHHGYRAVMVDGKKYYAHRIIWQMHFGTIPADKCIDHIDGNGSNNRLENLRVVTLSENQRNRKRGKLNKTGVDGVFRHKGGFSVYCASQYIIHTGDFFEACCARKSAERKFGYHQNHGRKAA